MLPLVLELPPGDLEGVGAYPRRAADLLAVEAIAAARGFGVDFLEIGGNVAARGRGILEAPELGMVLVALGLTLQHGLSQQRFAPERHETLGIQVSRMQRPESQCQLLAKAENMQTITANVIPAVAAMITPNEFGGDGVPKRFGPKVPGRKTRANT